MMEEVDGPGDAEAWEEDEWVGNRISISEKTKRTKHFLFFLEVTLSAELPLPDLVRRHPRGDLTSPGATVELEEAPERRCSGRDPGSNRTLGCGEQEWTARFWAWDEGDGLAGVRVDGAPMASSEEESGNNRNESAVHYR